jgi:hypothetical protein
MERVYHKFEEYFAVLLFHEYQYGCWYLCEDKDGNKIISDAYLLFEETETVYSKLKSK